MGDIKPQNILITRTPQGDVQAKWIDMETLRDPLLVRDYSASTACFRPKNYPDVDEFARDRYALGATIVYGLIGGKNVFLSLARRFFDGVSETFCWLSAFNELGYVRWRCTVSRVSWSMR